MSGQVIRALDDRIVDALTARTTTIWNDQTMGRHQLGTRIGGEVFGVQPGLKFDGLTGHADHEIPVRPARPLNPSPRPEETP